MSSSNLVRIAAIKEVVYGQTPGAGDFETARFTSDSLSGSPETTESQQIRTDRLSSGQIQTGLTLGGSINAEMAKEDMVDQFIESAMYNTWTNPAPVAVDLTLDDTAKTLTRSVGDWNGEVLPGDIITLSAFTNTENNTQVMVSQIQSATVITYVGPKDTLVDEVGSGTSFKVADYIEIGTTRSSFSMEKAFLDLTDKAIVYRGMIASAMNVSVAYGEIAQMNFEFSGNDYAPVDQAVDFITNGRTINPAGTTNSFNGSVDMPFIANGAVNGYLEDSVFCIQNLSINMNNNLTAQNCIGRIAPLDYTPGTALPEVSMSVYLADSNWNFLAKKLTQESFEVGTMVKNAGGFYGFYMPAVQVNFDDPASAGLNQDVIMEMSGQAKVGPSNEKSLKVFRG